MSILWNGIKLSLPSPRDSGGLMLISTSIMQNSFFSRVHLFYSQKNQHQRISILKEAKIANLGKFSFSVDISVNAGVFEIKSCQLLSARCIIMDPIHNNQDHTSNHHKQATHQEEYSPNLLH